MLPCWQCTRHPASMAVVAPVSASTIASAKFPLSNQLPPFYFSTQTLSFGKSSRLAPGFERISTKAVSVDRADSDVEFSSNDKQEMFDWNSQWYPVALPSELDKRVPTSVRVLGRDLVVWWDRNGKTWQVWEDRCPHRLAPLSEGRINEDGELQCSYHGWSFAPCSGNCTRIPQAPPNRDLDLKLQQACASVYPSVLQEGIIWFWPDTKPEFRNIAASKGPPSIPVLSDPNFNSELSSRDIPYGYEHLIENLMDPSHVPFAHHGLQGMRSSAKPLDLKVNSLDSSGYSGNDQGSPVVFTAPCVLTYDRTLNGGMTSGQTPMRLVLVFICIPVSPGSSRMIWAFRKNFSFWFEAFIPTWVIHLRQMLILDSDMYLLHLAERKLGEEGNANWKKLCFVPTSSDAFVIAFRKWLEKYAGGEPDWDGRYDCHLPPTPPKDQLMDRYSSHVKRCSHCSSAMKVFQRTALLLQALSVGIAAFLGASAIRPHPQVARWNTLFVIAAVVSLLASKWLSYFVKKSFYFHDYSHALVK